MTELGGFAVAWLVLMLLAVGALHFVLKPPKPKPVNAPPPPDPVGAHFATTLHGYTPAASLTPDEIATLADLERRLKASNVPYVSGFPTAEGDPK